MKRIQRNFRWLSLLAILVSSISCTSDEYEKKDNGDGSSVTFSLSVPGNIKTKAMDAAAETNIKTLDILVFKQVSGQELFDYRFSVDPASISSGNPRQFTTNVRLSSEPQRFVLIANAAEEIRLLSAAKQPKDDVLKALCITNPRKWNSGTGTFTPIPMWGQTDLVTINASGVTVPPITLFRMLAKINIQLKGAAVSKFTLQEAYLFNRNLKGRIVPDSWTGTAITPTLPFLASADSERKPAWHYSAADGITATGASNIIYIFETKAKNSGDLTDEFCVVVGGIYNSKKFYYRVDFKDATDNYRDILRNWRYEMEITDVLNEGATDPEDAFLGGSKLEATVTPWNDSNQNTIIDLQNSLKLDSTVVQLDWQGNLLSFGVVANPNTWSHSVGNLKNGITVSKTSSSILDFKGNGSTKNYSNITALDCGYIDLETNNLKYKLKVQMAPKPVVRWAGSNIYWDGNKLTFKDTDDTYSEDYQGVFFQWGSLWGISPQPTSFSQNTIVFPPTGGMGMLHQYSMNLWTQIPHISNQTNLIPPTGTNTGNWMYLYEHHNAAIGIGDICKHITDQGNAPGKLQGKKWRMPFSNEFENKSDYAGWTITTTPPAPNNPNDSGTYIVTNGRSKNPIGGFRGHFFPAAGNRTYTNGELYSVGTGGSYWSSSPNGTSGLALGFSSSTVSIEEGIYNRQYAFPIRCVQE